MARKFGTEVGTGRLKRAAKWPGWLRGEIQKFNRALADIPIELPGVPRSAKPTPWPRPGTASDRAASNHNTA